MGTLWQDLTDFALTLLAQTVLNARRIANAKGSFYPAGTGTLWQQNSRNDVFLDRSLRHFFPSRFFTSLQSARGQRGPEHNPVQFNSLRRLLKGKLVRLGEFDPLADQRRRERVERVSGTRRSRRYIAAPTAHAIGRAPACSVQVGRYPMPRSSSCSSSSYCPRAPEPQSCYLPAAVPSAWC
jgi:hypothetical protein